MFAADRVIALLLAMLAQTDGIIRTTDTGVFDYE
jgi:hypothetical protein